MYKYLHDFLIIITIIFIYIIYNHFLSENFTEINNITQKEEVWGINAKNQIWKSPLPCVNGYCNWSRVNGKIRQISQGENDIWGISDSNSDKYRTDIDKRYNIYKCLKPCKGEWINIPVSLKQISVGKDVVWGIDISNNLIYCNNTIESPCTDNWKNANTPNTPLVSQSTTLYANPNFNKTGELWAIDSKNQIWKAFLPCNNGICNWSIVNGIFKQIYQSDHDIWGILIDNSIMRCSKPCTGLNWVKVPGIFEQISVGKNSVWVVDNNNNIKYCDNTKDSPCKGNWKKINNNDASLSNIFL